MMTQNRSLVPGYVQVLVSASDVETAQAILNERRAPATGVETSAEEPEVRRRIDRFWVVVAIVFLGAILTRAIVDFWHF